MKATLRFILFTMASAIILTALPAHAQNERQAHDVIKKSLALLQNPGGAKFNYYFHLGMLFNRRGTMMYKDDKSLSWNTKTMVWSDGKTAWFLDRKKRVCKIYDPGTDRKGLKGIDGQLKSLTEDYNITSTIEGNNYKLRLKAANKNADAKEAVIFVNRTTYIPNAIKVKIGIIWGTVELSNFETGNYKDVMFTFDHNRFRNVKVIDKRK